MGTRGVTLDWHWTGRRVWFKYAGKGDNKEQARHRRTGRTEQKTTKLFLSAAHNEGLMACVDAERGQAIMNPGSDLWTLGPDIITSWALHVCGHTQTHPSCRLCLQRDMNLPNILNLLLRDFIVGSLGCILCLHAFFFKWAGFPAGKYSSWVCFGLYCARCANTRGTARLLMCDTLWHNCSVNPQDL